MLTIVEQPIQSNERAKKIFNIARIHNRTFRSSGSKSLICTMSEEEIYSSSTTLIQKRRAILWKKRINLIALSN